MNGDPICLQRLQQIWLFAELWYTMKCLLRVDGCPSEVEKIYSNRMEQKYCFRSTHLNQIIFIFFNFRTVDPDVDRKKYGISMLVSPNVLACDYRSYAKYIPLNSIPVNTIDEKM